MALTTTTAPVANFGRNIFFTAKAHYTPADEAELLAILREHAGEEIRAVGRLHCWGEAIRSDGVMIDLQKLNEVVIHREGDVLSANVGAGCQIKHLLAELRTHGLTTMSQGLIKEQTLAGATATGTHGSGGHSFSHSVQAVRVAHYAAGTDEPIVEEIAAGLELRAARCSLGCLGIVTQLRVAIRQAYFVEEHFQRYDSLDSVLDAEQEFPLQQFYFAPWRWDFFAQHRREVSLPRSWSAPLYRCYWSIGMDCVFHLVVMLLARCLPSAVTKFFYRRVLSWLVPRGWKVVDRSDVQLSMRHELFRHIETELFVTRRHLPAALEFLSAFLRHASGEETTLSDAIRRSLQNAELWTMWESCSGVYVQHYPLCIRQVLPDETLISMASGTEPMYSISLISYAAVNRRQGFFAVAEFLTRAMGLLFQARPHWGKHCPLRPADVPLLYPHWNEFQRIATQRDPEARFANAWLKETILGRSQ